jgi:hypothetical protein
LAFWWVTCRLKTFQHVQVGIPYLKWLPPFSWMYRRILASMAEFKQRMRELVQEGRDSYSEDEVRMVTQGAV